MKTLSIIFLPLFFLFACSPVLAQITFTTTDALNMFAVQKGQKQISADDTATYTMNVGVASSSQAQTWSLPVAKYTDTTLFTNVTPSSTPYAKDFPLATHAQTSSEVDTDYSAMAYLYYRIANDSLVYIGSATTFQSFGMNTTEFDSASEFIFKMPIALGTVVTSRDSSYLEPENYTIITSTTTFDAFGTITLPNGSFQCLRGTSVDINMNQAGAFVSIDTGIGFLWITKEGHSANISAVSMSHTSGTISVDELFWTELVSVSTRVPEGPTTGPNTFTLLQNYPNPFNPSTTISYTIPTRSHVTLSVFNTLGQTVTELVNGEKEAGSYNVTFDAAGLASGVYLYRMQAGSFVQTKKLVVVK